MRRSLRWTLRVVLILLMLLLGTAAVAWLALRGSLPSLDGEFALAGLQADARIERDAEGLATITAADRLDLARALGFLHAQERFFEMDLTRRSAAGELAALVGAIAVAVDRDARVHRFRTRAERWLEKLPADQRELLDAYTQGVNAGLVALAARPWPYLLLRQSPEPWRSEDSLLVIVAMFFDLQDASNERERQLDTARRFLAPAAFEFLVRAGTEWDAPLMSGVIPEPRLPTPDELDLHVFAARSDERSAVDEHVPGSNSFAVAGSLTPHGHAIVANDMHLGLRVPNIWFRTRLVHGEGEARTQLDGLTLPGAPGLVAGSNGHVSWAFTNSYGDWLDLIRLEVDESGDNYRTAAGWRAFRVISEHIATADGTGELLDVRETLWGPVIGTDVDGAPLALAWTAHRDGAVDASLTALEKAHDVDAAMAIATRAGIPVQNFIVGDAGGRIAWTLAGRMPARNPAHDSARPIDGATLEGDVWNSWLDPDAYPAVVDPPTGRLWTANARVVDGEMLTRAGDGGYDLGARAAQIRDGLSVRDRFDEADLLAIQLDDRALFLQRWWELLREVLAETHDDAALASLDATTRRWDGCACVDSTTYRLTREFRVHVHETVLAAFTQPVLAHDASFRWPQLGQAEGAVWQLLRERPAHLLPQPFDSWDELLRAQARRVVAAHADDEGGLVERTWGEANTARIRHPLAGALPGGLGRALAMPAQPLPGDSHMPRVQGTAFGASQRSVIAPGLEARSILHMPGGQTGHPLSPYFGVGHDDWAEGRPTALEPGTTRHTLRLRPLR